MSRWDHCAGLVWEGCEQVPAVVVYTRDERLCPPEEASPVWRPLCLPCRDACALVLAQVDPPFQAPPAGAPEAPGTAGAHPEG